jgi:hypothetical protein
MAPDVGDQDFDFGTSGKRREARTFEPPPWERDQFDRLAKERAEQEAAEAAARAAVELAASEGSATIGAAPAVAGVNPASAFDAQEAQIAASPFASAEAGAGSASGPVDERQVAVMMMDLKSEEPPALGGAWIAVMVAAIVLGAMGIVLTAWGLVELARAGGSSFGALGGGVLTMFGLGFAGLGAWLAFKTLRQQGVL